MPRASCVGLGPWPLNSATRCQVDLRGDALRQVAAAHDAQLRLHDRFRDR